MKKVISIIVISVIWLFIFPQDLSAQVIINEFQLSPSNNQWIELFNKGDDIDISGWIIDDSAGGSNSKFTIPSGTTLISGKCMSFESVNFYWNTATSDSVRLLSGSSVVEEYSYSISPGNNISIGRAIDGEGGLTVLVNQTRDKYNSSNLSCLASVSTPSPSPSSTPTQAPSKAIYKINKPKDDTGTELTSVQIYVDGEYIHHEDDEVLEFYSGHECYSGVNCSLGIHSISLRKIGYSNWGETNDFQVGMSLVVDPVLNKQNIASAAPTPVPTPTKTPMPIPTKTSTPRPTPSPTSTSQPEILGESTVLPTKTPLVNLKTSEPNNKPPVLAFVLVGLGTVFVGLAGFMAYKIRYNNLHGEKDTSRD